MSSCDKEERRRHQADRREAERLCKAAELDRDLRAQVGDVGDHRQRRRNLGDGGERDFAFVRREMLKLAGAPKAEDAGDAGVFSNVRCVARAARSRAPPESVGSHWAE